MSPRRAFVTVAAVLVALAIAIPVASSAGASARGNRARALADAARLLGSLHVPSDAVLLSAQPREGRYRVLGAPSYDEATPNLVDAHRWWRVRGTAAQVLAYVTARIPRDAKLFVTGSGGPRPTYYMKAFSLAPVPGVMSQRVIGVSVVQLTTGITAVRTDGEAVWVLPRPASERLPAGIQEIDIASAAFMSRSPIVALRVTNPAQVRQIVNWTNAMGIAQPGVINCPSLGGPIVTFVFRAAGGRRVARASGMDFDGSSGACNALGLRIGGRPQPPLIGDLFARVQRLLGVSLTSRRSARVHDVLDAAGIASLRFGAPLSAVRPTIDSLLGQPGGSYAGAGDCGVDHQVKWSDQWTANGEPALTLYFHDAGFVGYQYDDLTRPRATAAGWRLATTRGLRVGDPLSRGRERYGRAFTLSLAQGGSWRVRTATGRIDGYAWGTPGYGDVSWHSVVWTIDAGDVGCPAESP